MHATGQNIPSLKIDELVRRMNQANDTTYVINFWATFCKPCVAEIPAFIKLAHQYKTQKVKLVLVSLDLPSYYPKRIADFVKTKKWQTTVAWLNETNADHFCPMIDSGWSGAIPATVVINAKRGYKKFWEGDISAAAFEKELKQALAYGNTSGRSLKLMTPMNDVVKTGYYADTKNSIWGDLPSYATSFYSNDSTVFAVKEGTVISSVVVEDMQLLIIKNGQNYFSYSNLKTMLVKKGEKITAGQVIGFAAKDMDEGMSLVELYLSTEKETVILTKSDFVAGNKPKPAHRFSPMPGMEPE